jgi:hypothetical protein
MRGKLAQGSPRATTSSAESRIKKLERFQANVVKFVALEDLKTTQNRSFPRRCCKSFNQNSGQGALEWRTVERARGLLLATIAVVENVAVVASEDYAKQRLPTVPLQAIESASLNRKRFQ